MASGSGATGADVARRCALLAAASAAAYAAVAALRARRRRARGRYAVGGVCVYPLKSGAEVALGAERALASGFERDRVFQVTDAAGKYVTPRDAIGASALHPTAASLFHVRCELRLGDAPQATLSSAAGRAPPPLVVDVRETAARPAVAKVLGEKRPDDNRVELLDFGDEAAAWLQGATGIQGCRLQGIGPRYKRVVVANPDQGAAPASDDCPVSLADEAPYLLASAASLRDFRRRLLRAGRAREWLRVDMRRFRPNIVVEGALPWEEDTWKRIRIGRVEFHVWQRCGRCLMTTFDRDSLRRDDALKVLRGLRERPSEQGPGCGCAQSNFGMHLIPAAGFPAEISVGDELEVLERDPEREREWLQQHGPVWQLGLRYALGVPSRLF